MGPIEKKKNRVLIVAYSALVLLIITLLAIVIPQLLSSQTHQQLEMIHQNKNSANKTVPTASQATAHVEVPLHIPDAQSSTIKLQVNGQDIFVEKYKDINYASFDLIGQANLTVTTTEPASDFTISPRSYAIQASVNGNSLSFALTEPSKLILQSNTEKLFIFANAPETDVPQLTDPNVLDVRMYLSDTSGNTVQTAGIQKAIDLASQRHGIVYFPAGKYLSGSLNVKSNVSLYLSSGALLSGTGNIQDYQNQFILFDGSTNARLYGRGVIDLRGKQLRDSAGDNGRIKLIRTINASNITIQDLILRDAGSWTVHLLGSNTVQINNLKLINDMTNTNNDGIDPDSSSNITIDGTFLYTTDDCFAVKASGAFNILRPVQHIIIKNSICYDKKSALKVGTETKANLTDILFENNNIVHADRAIALYMSDGHLLENVRYQHNYAEVIGGDVKQSLISISITNRNGLGDIRGVSITDFTAYQFSPHDSIISGAPGHPIDVDIQRLTIAGQHRTSLADAHIQVSDAQVNFTGAP